MTHTEFYCIKILKPNGFCVLPTAVSIDGVAKMPFQASIFAPGKMILRHLNHSLILRLEMIGTKSLLLEEKVPRNEADEV